MRVLIAEPAGYVGRLLLRRLARDDRLTLRVVARDARPIRQDLDPRTDILEADLFDPATIQRAVRDIDVAYYPIRLASLDPGFEGRVMEFARRFRDSCIEAGVRRIVCLGTRLPPGDSGRLQSIMPESADILGACPERIQTVCLSTGIIIGPGSVFYEMVMSLVRRLPVLFLPRWTKATLKPVALTDVVEYLARAAFLEAGGTLTIEIGGERMTVADLFRLAARIHGRSKLMIPVPVAAPRLSASLLTFSSPFSYPLSLALTRFLEAARRRAPEPLTLHARSCFPEVVPLSCEEAFGKARAATGADEVESRWTDSLADLSHRGSDPALRRARYRDERRQDFGEVPPAKVFRSVLTLGGERGWFTFNLLWRIRGFMDKLLGGFGTSLGRRSPTDLRIGDMLDVWRVVDLVENERLLLQAQMKVFGEAWLEFRLRGNTLIQTAHYDPDGALGVLYWYAMLPFHAFIFPDMAKSIVRRAGEY